MDLLFMGRRDARRLGMVKAADQGRVTNCEAAQGLGLSVRQFRWLRKKVSEGDETSLVHGNRGPGPGVALYYHRRVLDQECDALFEGRAG